MPRFDNKIAVVTGAASGIGYATSIRLAQEGADIVALDLSSEGLEKLSSDIADIDRRCTTITGNVEELDSIDAAIESAVDTFGGLDYLVNNAGISGGLKAFNNFEPNEFDKMVRINLKSAWYGTKAAFDVLKKRGGGAIVNVSSMAGIRPNRFHSMYGITKAAMISMTQHAAMDYARSNIRVNCLCPGPVETPIFNQMEAHLSPESFQDTRQQLMQRTLMNRFSSPEEQASSVAYLLCDDAAFITGIALPVDGGWSVSDGHTK